MLPLHILPLALLLLILGILGRGWWSRRHPRYGFVAEGDGRPIIVQKPVASGMLRTAPAHAMPAPRWRGEERGFTFWGDYAEGPRFAATGKRQPRAVAA